MDGNQPTTFKGCTLVRHYQTNHDDDDTSTLLCIWGVDTNVSVKLLEYSAMNTLFLNTLFLLHQTYLLVRLVPSFHLS